MKNHTQPILITVPEMGKMLGLFEAFSMEQDYISITTIHPDGSRHEFHVIFDDQDNFLDRAAFWCVWSDGEFQRNRTVPPLFLNAKPCPKEAV
jgi:hypothetical protein